MKRTSRISFVMLLLVALGGVAWFLFHQFSRTDDPVYLGTRLSKWLTAFTPPTYYQASNRLEKIEYQSGLSKRDAHRAVRDLGTNAFPVLFRFLTATGSPLKTRLISLFEKQHFLKRHFLTASDLRNDAETAFSDLGIHAEPAVPALIKLYEASPSPEIRSTIASILGSMGPGAAAAIPALQRDATSTNSQTWNYASNALENIRRARNSYPIDYLTQFINPQDSQGSVRAVISSMRANTLYGGDPHETARLLIGLLQQPGGDAYWVKFLTAQFDPDAASRVLTNHESDPVLPRSSGPVFPPAPSLAAGYWSELSGPNGKYVDLLHGRLLVSPWALHATQPDGPLTATLFLQLQHVSVANNPRPTAVLIDTQESLHLELRDSLGHAVPPGTLPSQAATQPPSWAMVPPDGSVQFQFGQLTASNAGPKGILLSLGAQSWSIPSGDTNVYFLSGMFNPTTNQPNVFDYDIWKYPLSLPPVKLQVPKM